MPIKIQSDLPVKEMCIRDRYTPMFAIARIVGWSAHRMEELINTDKIIRPAYKNVMEEIPYVPLEKRQNERSDAVSYTHLDVYKRQYLDWAKFPIVWKRSDDYF